MQQRLNFRYGPACARGIFFLFLISTPVHAFPQQRNLTPLQLDIQTQVSRLSSAEVEERRDAVMRLGALRHAEASRAAVGALHDAASIVRATATAAVLWLPADESAIALIPLLSDKDEFVRQETAYALGRTKSRSAAPTLIERLASDQSDGVRGAAAIALGQIGDDASVISLVQVLRPNSAVASGKKSKKKKKIENALVLRAAARSLGLIGNRAAVPALLSVVGDDKGEDDVRREAATALGLIGDPSALPILKQLQTSQDPALSLAAFEAVLKISNRITQRS
ncbi:MAG: HEAT repeat domain-containing protein [bacterium]